MSGVRRPGEALIVGAEFRKFLVFHYRSGAVPPARRSRSRRVGLMLLLHLDESGSVPGGRDEVHPPRPAEHGKYSF